ncbi:MAG: hypothetical protein B7Z80_20605 [Rhodospirillales bacterium 20-64-7]|nr:MAG: hypothetical protein B7Z80_20605 [Rhodospirillales bacterium 20-64-7]
MAVGIQLGQKAGCVIGIGARVESLIEGGKGLRVEHQIHLQATNVDRLHATGLQGPDRGDGVLLGFESVALSLGIDGPGPGTQAPRAKVDTGGFGQADRGQQPRW